MKDIKEPFLFKKVGTVISTKVDGDALAARIGAIFSINKLDRILEWGSKTTIIFKGTNEIPLKVGTSYFLPTSDITISTATDLDTGTISNGKDYYVYACDSSGTLVFKISLASTYPAGYDANTSRKIGGFHTLCVSAGNIAGGYTARANNTAYASGDIRRPASANSRYYICITAGTSAASEPAAFTSDATLTGAHVTDGTVKWLCEGHDLNLYVANEILPLSVWDLKHRCRNGRNEGMRYSPEFNKWKQIYLASDDGAGGVASVYNATILDTIDWMRSVDMGKRAHMRLLDDDEFQGMSAGCNQRTNIAESEDPVTTGGKSDDSGRRMISNGGDEDDAGSLWQWLRDQSFRIEGSHNHTENTAASYTQNAVTAAKDIAAWGFYTLPEGKGSLYRQGTYGDVKLRAGGYWGNGAYCGSRSRGATLYRWNAGADIGSRFLSECL